MMQMNKQKNATQDSGGTRQVNQADERAFEREDAQLTANEIVPLNQNEDVLDKQSNQQYGEDDFEREQEDESNEPEPVQAAVVFTSEKDSAAASKKNLTEFTE